MADHGRLCAVMAQILSIYGLVTSVIISNNLTEKMALFTGFIQLGSGMAVGLCGMAAGFAIGIVGDAGGKIVTADMDTSILVLYSFQHCRLLNWKQ